MRKKVEKFTDLFDTSDFRWPKNGDKLFKRSQRWDGGVGFPDHPYARDAHIWDGYMTAASVLVEHCKNNDVSRFDLVYPILFNYRHGLEAAIKWVLDRYGRYAAIKTYEKDHNLHKLWKVCRQVIEEVGGQGGDDEALNAVEKIVHEFHSLDPESFSFRYSTKKNGKVVELPDFAIDLEHLGEVMEGVNNFFTGVDGQLDHNSSAVDHYY
jgi:hypothetical protein